MESLSVGILRFATQHAAEIAYLHAKGRVREGQECSEQLLRNRQRIPMVPVVGGAGSSAKTGADGGKRTQNAHLVLVGSGSGICPIQYLLSRGLSAGPGGKADEGEI